MKKFVFKLRRQRFRQNVAAINAPGETSGEQNSRQPKPPTSFQRTPRKTMQSDGRHGKNCKRSQKGEAIVRHHVQPRQTQQLDKSRNVQTPTHSEQGQKKPESIDGAMAAA